MTGMTTTAQLHAKKIIEELKKDPGKPTRELGNPIGLREPIVRKILNLLEGSDDPETKQLVAKRAAYSRGGTYIAKQIKKEPGCGYRQIDNSVREGAGKDRVKKARTEEIFEGVVDYCKKWKDKELRELLSAHKKAGGWMP